MSYAEVILSAILVIGTSMAAGYYLNFTLFIFISFLTVLIWVVCIIILVQIRSDNSSDIRELRDLWFRICVGSGAFSLTLWTTYYWSTDQTWMGNFIQHYILR